MRSILTGCLILLTIGPAALAQHLVLSNPLTIERSPQVIEVPLQQLLSRLHLQPSQAASLVAQDASTGERIPSQIYASNPDAQPDQLLLFIGLPAHEKRTIAFHLDASAPAQPALVFGREAPERKDDFAWENQQVAYRIYGPALEAAGEITSGIDVWSKRVPNFVIDSFYKRDAEGARTHNPDLTYHKDNGQGLDSYYVGPTRGCGGTAVVRDGKLFVSKNYTHIRMMGNGPIRFAFTVTYAPWDAGGATVTEKKTIVLDAGTHLNRIESTYSFGGVGELSLAAGIAVHEGAQTAFPAAGEIAAAWDTPQDPSAGRISTGLVAAPSQQAKTLEAANHALLVFTRKSGEPFLYYAGSGWSKADMPTAAAWNAYLMYQLQLLEHPVTLRWNR